MITYLIGCAVCTLFLLVQKFIVEKIIKKIYLPAFKKYWLAYIICVAFSWVSAYIMILAALIKTIKNLINTPKK